MKRRQTLLGILLLFSLLLVFVHATPHKRESGRRYYTLHIPKNYNDNDGHDAAQHVANSLRVRLEGNVGELKNYYLVSAAADDTQMHKRDDTDPIIEAFHAHKRRHLTARSVDATYWNQVERIDPQIPRQRHKRVPLRREPPFSDLLHGKAAMEDAQKTLGINDPGFPKQWHLVNQDIPGNDMNVTGVWKQGITGNGTIVAILDDGLDYDSEDLKGSFYAEGSYDFNDHVDLPKPRLWDDTHGTRCAGQIAAQKNTACGVGIAYGSKVAGVRILSGEITDADEAAALNYKFQDNHIYSCSWGPPDNGETMEAPTGILADAFVNGIENGRGGKGSIYVFATGNGAVSGDNCNFDGYTNSIYTITVGAIDFSNKHPPYSEACSAQMVVTYSSGGGQYIYTTNVGENECSDRHGGTSAAAPSAAGIFALVLSVRPDLTWRDLQHLCVQTAVPISEDDDDWKQLPSGRIYNHKYGYGKLDAYAIVEAARKHELVNKQTFLELPIAMEKTPIPDSTKDKSHKPLRSMVKVTDEMVKNTGMKRLEHITVTVNIEHQRRGDIVVTLESPNKVQSELATMRPGDKDPNGMTNWKFMTVKHWEENPVGDWTLIVSDGTHAESTGSLLNWTMTLYGEMDPAFTGEPIQRPLESHSASVTVTHAPAVSSPSSAVEAVSTTSEHVPARPTRIKPSSSSSSSSSSISSSSSSSVRTSKSQAGPGTTESVSPGGEPTQAPVEDVNDETETSDTVDSPSGGSTAIYAVVGTGAILTLATGMYLQKRKVWSTSNAAPGSNVQQQPQPSGYEFTVLRRSEEAEDDEPLLTRDQRT
ncbi:peptidase S8/S53 domain-containing protein [Syncephalastrum racemosum]|uniref:Peptidase S8/S53 domain-containing protein n=1 Tax=Syncephalastrum racemosum TaxID=13706 RepID=A0A1X2HUK7_SYNRA|nr:peptidase S8/S53 domain-containing protein [Syncephalastrum racemosum]